MTLLESMLQDLNVMSDKMKKQIEYHCFTVNEKKLLKEHMRKLIQLINENYENEMKFIAKVEKTDRPSMEEIRKMIEFKNNQDSKDLIMVIQELFEVAKKSQINPTYEVIQNNEDRPLLQILKKRSYNFKVYA